MIKNIKLANFFAKKSCTKWNKNRVSRRISRSLYRKIAEVYWHSYESLTKIAIYKSGFHRINTYPWPYSDEHFADWPESDDSDDYTLISDQSGCVIKYATSYCAWKIFEATGKWPQRTSRTRLDAKNWVQFLKEAGYTEVVEEEDIQNGYHYIGIIPDIGEWGLVTWFEGITPSGEIEYSTYINKVYTYAQADFQNIIWVKI